MAYFSITLADDYGRQTRKLIEIEDKTTVTEYETLAGTFKTALDAVTDLALVRFDLIIDGIATGFVVTSGANVDVGGTFVGYLVDANGKKGSLKIPGFKPALVDPDGSIPITGAVTTYLAQWLDATPNEMLLSDGEAVESWIAGHLDK